MSRLTLALLALLAVAAPALAACTENAPADAGGGGGERAITVEAGDDSCEVSSASAPAGSLTFDVANAGSEVTEFYVLAEDGLRILGEVENIGPGLERQLVLSVPEGSYMTACKPGMRGDGIRDAFTVEASEETVEVSDDEQAVIDDATANYAAYVQDQTDQLLTRTRRFTTLYADGDDAQARALYPVAREHWERIETVAESFGDLDPRMDAREADLEPGQRWTGWHRIEKDLWPQRARDYTPLTDAERTRFGEGLLADTEDLRTRVQDLSYGIDDIANGSIGLLEEVATGKVTGEEEYWSRTDLYDFQANVDGARVAYDGVAALLQAEDPELATTIDDRFTALQDLLDDQREGDGFRSYDELSRQEVAGLADAVNGLSEPLSQLTGVLLA